MASAATQLLTAEEFYEFVFRRENEARSFELVAGEIIEMSRPGHVHSAICANVSFVLGLFVRQRRAGHVCSNDMGIVLERDPDTVRGPDVALYLDQRKLDDLPLKFTEHLPQLVVEVLSPSDRLSQAIRKINSYLDAGIGLAWLIDPEDRSVTLWRRDKAPVVLTASQEIEGLPELPGFRCNVSDFFFPGN
ncbi:MAG: Uma2 family endonuclease [Gemmataceae bacterium]|nr:Uma2 family endonuclease [Gemmataceae bacterium]